MLMIMLRFFKGFRGQPRVAVLLEVMNNATNDFLHFFLIFIIVFLNYSIAAHALYGQKIQHYSTLLGSMESLFAIL
jgi:hypothetical protein